MRKINEYDSQDTPHIMGAQPHKLMRKEKHSSVKYKFQEDFEGTDKAHEKYNRGERRDFIRMANKLYCRPIVH